MLPPVVPSAGVQAISAIEAVEPAIAGDLTRADSPSRMGEALERICAGPVLARTIDLLLASERDAAAAASASYEHPNGFDKLVLASLPSGHKVVLHAWPAAPAGRGRKDANLHNHRWHFATRVLAGSYRYTEYEDAPPDASSAPVFHEHRYTTDGTDGGHQLTAQGPRRLAIARSLRLCRGDVYLLHSSVIHSIALDDEGPTVTLFVQGPAVRESTKVFSTAPLSEYGQVNPPRFTVAEYRRRLANLRQYCC
jgi:hypothetical protein